MKTFFSSLACANKVSCQTLSNYFPNFPWSSFFLGLKSLMEWWRQAWKPTLTDIEIHLGFHTYMWGPVFKIISKVVWLYNITSFFIPMKMCYLELRLALVSCHYLDFSMNLKQCLKSWVYLLGKVDQLSAFTTFWKRAWLWEAVVSKLPNQQKTDGYQWKDNVQIFNLILRSP